MTEAYCVKCRAKKPLVHEIEVTMKNGRPAVRGQCSVCGTNVFKIVTKPKENPNI